MAEQNNTTPERGPEIEEAANNLHYSVIVGFTALYTLADMIDATEDTNRDAGIRGLIEGIAGNLKRAADTFEPHL